MAVIHILKDGTIVKDITGKVVKMEDAPALYELMRKIKVKDEQRTV
jgi:hypothetical protein